MTFLMFLNEERSLLSGDSRSLIVFNLEPYSQMALLTSNLILVSISKLS